MYAVACQLHVVTDHYGKESARVGVEPGMSSLLNVQERGNCPIFSFTYHGSVLYQ